MRAASARDAAILGFAFGLGWFVGGVSWVHVSLHTFGAMPAPTATPPEIGWEAVTYG